MNSPSHTVLFFTPTASPVGGVETWLDRVYRHLRANGHKPLVLLARGAKFNDIGRFRRHHPELPAIEVDGRGLGREGRTRAVMRWIRRTRPAIIVPLGSVDAVEAAVRSKEHDRSLRVVVHAQGNLPPMLADLEDYRDGLDLVVCPGRLTTDHLTRTSGFEPHRVRNVPNGAAPPTTPRVERRPGSPLRLGYVGRFTLEDKRVGDIPRLCRRLRDLGVDFTLQLAGDGPARAAVVAELAPLGERVTDNGPLSAEELYRRIYPQLDVVLLFSSSETFGIVLAEAMMNEVVPATSEYLGFHSERLVVDGENGLSFPIGDIEAAAVAVARLTSEPLRRRLADGAKYVREAYTWGRCLAAWSQALEDALSLPQNRPATFPAAQRGTSRLDRWRVPAAVTDTVRRVRIAALGSPVPPGGEEWPLFRRHHSESRLARIEASCRKVDGAWAADPADDVAPIR